MKSTETEQGWPEGPKEGEAERGQEGQGISDGRGGAQAHVSSQEVTEQGNLAGKVVPGSADCRGVGGVPALSGSQVQCGEPKGHGSPSKLLGRSRV